MSDEASLQEARELLERWVGPSRPAHNHIAGCKCIVCYTVDFLATSTTPPGEAAVPATDELKAKRLASTDGSYIEEFLADPYNRRIFNEESAKEEAEEAAGASLVTTQTGPTCGECGSLMIPNVNPNAVNMRCVNCGGTEGSGEAQPSEGTPK